MRNVALNLNLYKHKISSISYKDYDSIDNVCIYCCRKVGEIVAATSIAKYIKTKFNKKVFWVTSKEYKNVLEMIPYIDEVIFFDDNLIYKNVYQLFKSTDCHMKFLNNFGVRWRIDNCMFLNSFFRYPLLNANTPFNEIIFSCLDVPYNVKYFPDIKFSDYGEKKAEEFINKFNNFIILFPYGYGSSCLKFSFNDYNNLHKLMLNNNIKLIITGKEKNKNFYVNFDTYFGLDLHILFSLFKRANGVVGPNSGIVFSAFFCGCKNLIIESPNTSTVKWSLYNIKTDITRNLYQANKITIEDILRVFVRKKI